MGITHTHNSTYPADLPGEKNVRWRASFEFLPKSHGNDHLVFRGRMFRPGPDFYLTKQHAVVKVSKTKPTAANDWEYYIRCAEEARKYNRLFRDIIKHHHLKIEISFLRSCAAPVDTVSKVTAKVLAKKYKRKFKSSEYVIIERFLKGKFQDFISVVGEVLDKRIGILEAFSHYTYWQSSGELIVCSLKGVRSTVDRDADGEWKILELTSPCIHSIDGDYGPDDLGEEGMKFFFEQHKCNKICNSWADFDILNRQLLLNNSLVPVDADDAGHVEVTELLPEDKQDTKGSPDKEKIIIDTETFDSLIDDENTNSNFVRYQPNGYMPKEPLSNDYMSIHADENDSGCESLPTDNVSTSNDSISSTDSYELLPDSTDSSPHSPMSETTKHAYVKFSMADTEIDHRERTIPKYGYFDFKNPNTIVFQYDGEGTMKPIIKNGYARYDDIEIKIESQSLTRIDSFDHEKKSKRVSWGANVVPH